MTIVVTCEQGSPQWHQARAGVITASMFGIVRKKVGALNEQQQKYVDAILLGGHSEAEAMMIAGYRARPRAEGIERTLAGERVGDFCDAAKDYAFRLAIERISGEPLDDAFETFAMRRGHELEPAARAAHEVAAGVVVKPCGFVLTDDGVFGASADGYIGEDGGAEFKCLIAPDRLREIIIDGKLDDFADQVQGGLWISGRKFWHFALYCPALAAAGKELWWREWKRDDDYIETMEQDLLAFKVLVDSHEAKLRDSNFSTERKAA